MLVILRVDLFLNIENMVTWPSHDRHMIHFINHDYSGNQKKSRDMSLVSVKWTEYNL